MSKDLESTIDVSPHEAAAGVPEALDVLEAQATLTPDLMVLADEVNGVPAASTTLFPDLAGWPGLKIDRMERVSFTDLEPVQIALMVDRMNMPQHNRNEFSIGSFDIDSLPDRSKRMLAPIIGRVNMSTEFLVSHDVNFSSQGRFLPNEYGDFPQGVQLINGVPGSRNTGIGEADIAQRSDAFVSTVVHEFSHALTESVLLSLTDETYAQGGGRHSAFRELVSDFDHETLPDDWYPVIGYNELAAHAFEFSAVTHYLESGLTRIGTGTNAGYELNRDFVAFNTSRFLAAKGITIGADEIEAYFDARTILEDPAERARFHLDDPELLVFLRDAYQSFGEDFYAHLGAAIDANRAALVRQ